MSQSIERLAQCACGQLKVRVVGDPQLVSSCHCRACQRRTGTLFGTQAFFKREQTLAVEGAHKTFTRRADSGTAVVHQFCPECGTTLLWERASLPGMVTLAVGAFADPDFPPPVRTVWTESKHQWLPFPAHIRQYPQAPD
ncbi:MAG: GFA family protein [Alphaproteobacteria bacterium]|nr:GFA family protein [Alphaproteobacteria bacterium]